MILGLTFFTNITHKIFGDREFEIKYLSWSAMQVGEIFSRTAKEREREKKEGPRIAKFLSFLRDERVQFLTREHSF
jgi:ascorbate-specific PTS system EIIC-type component UlaA